MRAKLASDPKWRRKKARRPKLTADKWRKEHARRKKRGKKGWSVWGDQDAVKAYVGERREQTPRRWDDDQWRKIKAARKLAAESRRRNQ